MPLHRFRIFTLEQANELLPSIAALTQRTRDHLDRLRALDDDEATTAQQRADHDARELLDRWAQSVLALGAQPKGVFTVDFRSPDPNVLWCWAPDEARICHRHFTWETFKDRIELRPHGGPWPGRN